MFSYTLGSNVQVGNRIRLKTGWKKVETKNEKGVETADGFIEFGSTIYGWAIK